MARDYEARIIDSTRELTAREKVKFKDTSAFPKFNEMVTKDSGFVFAPDFVVTVEVHNGLSKGETEYTHYVYVAKDGNAYVSGSETLHDSVVDIMVDMEGEEYEIEVREVASKNYSGNGFLKAVLV